MLPISSKLLKTWSGLTRWLLWATVLAWLTFGVFWATMHWLIVPRIGEFRPLLETQASRALGVAVRVGAVSARSSGLTPSFELTDVALFDSMGRVALSLPKVLVALSPRSLWRLGFEQLYIDQPRLDIRRGADGRITVAGLDFSSTAGSSTAALDWFFSQVEFAIHDGTVRWTDEQRAAEPVQLQQVDLLVRNLGRHHDMRLDATPPGVWGARFNVQGRFLQPLLARRNGQWRDWEGQLFAAFEHVDLHELRRYADPGFDLSQGKGALRAWVDVSRGQITGATADVALAEVALTLAADLQPMALQQLQGRISGRLLPNGFEFATRSLMFDSPQGLHWPGGNVRVLSLNAQGKSPARGEVQADRLDLAALTQIAHRLPLDAGWRNALMRYAPKGQVDTLNASWQGAATAPVKYSAKGRLSQLELAAVDGAPGVRGLNLDFDLDQSAGRATLSMTDGSVDVPGIFQEGLISIDQMSANARWQTVQDHIAVQLTGLKFANADTQGEAQIKWQTSDPKKSPSKSRFPGLLDLQAKLSRAEGRRVHRYLPLVIDQRARDYVREAVLDGNASNVRFVVKGDIYDIPAMDARRGEFRISADVKAARLAYVPPGLQEANELPWPALNDLSGELVIDRLQLMVKGARARLGDNAAVQVTRADATIADLLNTEVAVSADFKGPAPVVLKMVNDSPLAELTARALTRTVVSGNADYKLKLLLPVADLGKSSVQGSISMAGNDLQISPDTPKLTRTRGVLNFTQHGITLAGVQTRMLGGDVRLEGGLLLSGSDNTHPSAIRAAGLATAEGLRQATELGLVARLARQINGSAAYNASFGLRRGVPELLVTSNLQGMAASLPSPLTKNAQSLLPLRYQTSSPGAPLSARRTPAPAPLPMQDRLTLTLGNLVSLTYERDVSGTEPRVLRGAIGIGADTLDTVMLPEQGINANIHLPQFNVDAWADLLAQVTAAPLGTPDAGKHPELAYLPSNLAVRADVLTFGTRQFNRLVLGAGRDGLLWRANVDAAELNGYLEYRQPDAANANSAGAIYGRLTRLIITPSTANDVEALLDTESASVPALDLLVDDFELRGKRLGRLEIDAVNRLGSGPAGATEWRLNKLNLSMPEATLTASGNWARLNAQNGGAPGVSNRPERHRTVMNFKLDIADGGKLLNRFGMKDVVRQASGKIEGQMAWIGPPFRVDYPTLGGAVTVNVLSGQFLKADPGLTKLLGVLSLQALPRRLVLDFRDVFSDGFAFDFLRGNVAVEKGLARTNNLQMKGVNAAVLMEGVADIDRETQDLKVVVVPELNAGTAALIATVINPAIGLGSFLAQLFLSKPLIESATQEFHVDGSWADPQVTKVKHIASTSKEKTP